MWKCRNIAHFKLSITALFNVIVDLLLITCLKNIKSMYCMSPLQGYTATTLKKLSCQYTGSVLTRVSMKKYKHFLHFFIYFLRRRAHHRQRRFLCFVIFYIQFKSFKLISPGVSLLRLVNIKQKHAENVTCYIRCILYNWMQVSILHSHLSSFYIHSFHSRISKSISFSRCLASCPEKYLHNGNSIVLTNKYWTYFIWIEFVEVS